MDIKTWVTAQDASSSLGVSEETLHKWREVGYLKAGTHWRSATNSNSFPWKPEVIYHLPWCREEMDYWRDQDAPIIDKAA